MKADSAGVGGGVPSGFTVRSAERVTPPPVTEIVTTVVWDTDLGSSWMAPLVVPAGMVTLPERKGSTEALLLVTSRYWSKEALDATVTDPWTEPLAPVVVVGKSVRDVGFGDGATVSSAWVLLPFQFAVMVTGVLVATSLVGNEKEAEGLPAATDTVLGGMTAGELLDRLTTAPAAGA